MILQEFLRGINKKNMFLTKGEREYKVLLICYFYGDYEGDNIERCLDLFL